MQSGLFAKVSILKGRSMAYGAISPEEKAQPPSRFGVQALALVAVCLSLTLISTTYLRYLPLPL